MYHPKKSIAALLLLGALFSGCSQYEDIDVYDNNEVTKQETGIVFRIRTNASSDPTTRSAEDSYNHVQGTPDEYKVNNAIVYLFDAPSKSFAKSFELTNLKRLGSDANGYIIYETEHVAVSQGTYDIFVIANTDRKLKTDNISESEFLANIDSVSYVRAEIEDISKGIIMTNRASENAGTVILNTEENEDVVINITLERVLARIDVAKGSETFQLTDNNNKMYASITLDGYYIVNLPKYYYSYRHTAVLTSLTEPVWNLNENFGNVKDVNGYVIDPYFFKKKTDASGFANEDKYYEHFYGDYEQGKDVRWTSFKPVGNAAPDYNTVYCLENCTMTAAQKNGYSTGIIFRAKMEPYNNVYHLSATGNMELITDTSKYPEVLYYFNYKFYDSAEALQAAVNEASATGLNLDLYKARKFEKTDDGYRSYYKYWIRHLDNNKNSIMGLMEFAIVRNNLYRILVTNVSDLGSPILVVDPDIPDEGETYLSVVLNVKPWIVRDLTNIVL
jgi:hypothetical protein